MGASEPAATAYLLLAAGLLLAVSVVLSRATARLGMPVALGFLVIGMLAGSEGVGRIPFDDYRLAFRLGTVALVLILFDGGLQTKASAVRPVLAPAGLLATAGVVVTAAIASGGARLAGLGWQQALLLGAIVSSTDAAAVFSVLRTGAERVQQKVADLLEVESGLNDPMAVILATALTSIALGAPATPGSVVAEVAIQFAVGALVGAGAGFAGRAMLVRIRPQAAGLFPVATLALAFLAFALATVLNGSGFLAVYVAGFVLGAGRIPYQSGVGHVHDAIAWFGQVTMFLVLGLLVFPSRLVAAAPVGLAVSAVLLLVARPVAVLACLAPFGWPARETAFVSWAGLRGAVPIVLATFPVMAGVAGSERLFDVVFFVVVMNAFLPGATLRWAARWLGLQSEVAAPPRAVLEISASQALDHDVLAFHVSAASAVAGASLAELPLPPGALVMLVVRGSELIAPRGSTRLEPGDHAYVLCRPEEQPDVKLMFGQVEET